MREWPHYPFANEPVIAYDRIGAEWGTTNWTERFRLSLVEGDRVLARATLLVTPIERGPSSQVGKRPACTFFRMERQGEIVVLHRLHEYFGAVYAINGIPLPGHDDKQIVDMWPDDARNPLRNADPLDNVIKWNCRRGRPGVLDLVQPDTMLDWPNPRPLPLWAHNRFSIEVDTIREGSGVDTTYGGGTGPGEIRPAVMAFEGLFTHSDDLEIALLGFMLTDTINSEVVRRTSVWVDPRCGGDSTGETPACLRGSSDG